MSDEVRQTFVRSFIDYLKKQIDAQAFTPDAQESCEVAVQCLQAAFDIGDEEAEVQAQTTASPDASTTEQSSAPKNAKEVKLFDLFEMHYLEKNPDILKMAESIKNEGNRLMKDGKYNEALLQYNRAITYDPRNPIFYCNRAAAYIRLGDNEKAVTDCKSALVYNPSYSKAYGRLGIAYSNLSKYEEAQQAYAKAIELEPDNEDYRNNLEVARTARQQSVTHSIRDGIGAVLSQPGLRNLFGPEANLLENLNTLTQDPAVMNIIGRMSSILQGSHVSPDTPMDRLYLDLTNELTEAVSRVQQRMPENNASNDDQPPPPAAN